jgi:predicted metal-dependent enzyme (double-stranded beta helix superfamily)
MSLNFPFHQLEQDIRSVLEENKEYGAIVEQIRPFLQKLLQSEGLVPDNYLKPHAEKYAQYLLYKPEDEAFSVIAFIWGAGQKAPVHDHLIWGLVGVYEGEVEETRYRRIDNGLDAPQQFTLEAIKTIKAVKGDISFVYPPNYDIHGVSNLSDEIAVTIHIYGADIGKKPRHIHDPLTGSLRDVVTKHDNTDAIYH